MISRIFPELGDNPFKTEKNPQKDAISSYLEGSKPDKQDILTYLRRSVLLKTEA